MGRLVWSNHVQNKYARRANTNIDAYIEKHTIVSEV